LRCQSLSLIVVSQYWSLVKCPTQEGTYEAPRIACQSSICVASASIDSECLTRCDREETLAEVDLNPEGLTAEITRLVKKRRLANPRHGFYLILRTEDPMAGAQIQFPDRPLRNTRESMHVLQQLRIEDFRSI